jgi:hypothetical protein
MESDIMMPLSYAGTRGISKEGAVRQDRFRMTQLCSGNTRSVVIFGCDLPLGADRVIVPDPALLQISPTL